MQFVQALFTVVSLVALSQAAAIPPSASSGSNDGMLGGMCDQIATRFYKFGQCISSTAQFSTLNSTFWYQAARHELCGYPFSQEPAPSDANSTSVDSNGKSNTATDVQLELQAEYLYLMQTSGANATISSDSEFSATTNEYMTPEKRDSATFGLSQCVNACDILQKYSNYVEPCWEVTGLTVLYGVCEVGCRYYF